MDRITFYKELDKSLRESILISGEIYFVKDSYSHLLKTNKFSIDNNTSFFYQFNFGNWHGRIEDKAFDKYYNSFTEEYWKGKENIVYTQSDIDNSINNIKYMILNEFSKNFFK